ncbi:MAG: RidA family protein [Microthrixaceae bacterium]
MSGQRRRIGHGSDFEAQMGYARAVVDGRWVFVSGTTGFDYTTMTIADDVVAQVDQALVNIDRALREAGASAADVVRVRYLLPNREDFEPCWPSLRAYFGDAPPAATMQVCGLADPRMRIEVEVTALKAA